MPKARPPQDPDAPIPERFVLDDQGVPGWPCGACKTRSWIQLDGLPDNDGKPRLFTVCGYCYAKGSA